MINDSPRRAAALALAHAGVPTFPCMVNEKRPAGMLVPNGLKDRTTEVAIIESWFKGGADWNIAFVPDDIGCFVIDIDIKHDGLTTWRNLCAEHGWQPRCNLMVKTPSGGWHLYYKGSMAPSVGSQTRGMGPGIDIRGRGSYVLLPPSQINGVPYTYVQA